jgi:hypothetical protein
MSGLLGNFDSSLLTKNKQTRVVFSNVLRQRTAVQNGASFMVIQGPGKSGPVNTFAIAANTGSLNLSPAEFNAIARPGSA